MSEQWPTVKLGEVLRLDLDRHSIDAAANYPMVGVLSFGRGLFDREPIENGNTSYRFFYLLKAEHIVMSQLFGWEGALAFSSEKFAGKFVSPQFPTFLCDEKKLNRKFLGWLMRRPAFWEDLGSRTSGMGDRRRTLNPEALFKCEIPLPPLAEQRRVVARIEGLAAQVHEIKNLRAEEDTQLCQMLLGAFGSVAKSAPRVAMRQAAPLVRRPSNIEPSDSYAELGIRSFGKGTFHKPALSGFALGSKRIFRIEKGDLLFSNVFAWEGAIAVAKSEDDGRFGSHRFMSCVPKPGIATANFLRFYFLANDGIELIRAASPGGAGRNRTLGIEALANIEVPVPSIEKQRWFDALQAEVDELKRIQAETAAELDVLLPAILDRAFNGSL
jgi:type I restriction enzyme, S subunit